MTYEYFGEMKPYAHQLQAIKFMLANKRGYLFLEMGLGKSATCLWYSDMLMEMGKIGKVLIISPLSTLHPVWAAEVTKVCPYRKYVVVHGNRSERIAALKSDAKIFITNTDCVRTYRDELIALRPDVIIIDEVTSFANHGSQRSKAMQALSKTAKAVFGLSGSPLANGLMASFGIAKVVRPEGLPNKYMSRYRDMILSQVNLYEYVPRPGALGIVNKALSPAIKFSIEECVDLPPITFEERFVELPSSTMKVFKEILKHQLAEFKDGLITAQTAGVKAIRLLQISTGFCKTEEGEIIPTDISPKMMELLSLYYESGCKLVIFAQSVYAVKMINQFFLDKKIHSRFIYGNVNMKQRGKIVDEFQDLDEGVLVAQVKTVSHGLTLTKSRVVVFFGPCMGNETFRQAIARIRRIGQSRPQTVIKLVSTKFEKGMFAKLDEKELNAQAVLDMYSNGMKEFI